VLLLGSGYGTTHDGSSYFKTYSTIPPSMTQFQESGHFVTQRIDLVA